MPTPRLVMPFGSVICVIEAQSEKARLPILVTVFAIITLVR